MSAFGPVIGEVWRNRASGLLGQVVAIGEIIELRTPGGEWLYVDADAFGPRGPWLPGAECGNVNDAFLEVVRCLLPSGHGGYCAAPYTGGGTWYGWRATGKS